MAGKSGPHGTHLAMRPHTVHMLEMLNTHTSTHTLLTLNKSTYLILAEALLHAVAECVCLVAGLNQLLALPVQG